jgi:hypothetical protein
MINKSGPNIKLMIPNDTIHIQRCDEPCNMYSDSGRQTSTDVAEVWKNMFFSGPRSLPEYLEKLFGLRFNEVVAEVLGSISKTQAAQRRAGVGRASPTASRRGRSAPGETFGHCHECDQNGMDAEKLE